MSLITDLNGYLNAADLNSVKTVKHSTNAKAGSDMDMTDYLKLMVATFQNQSIDDVASTSDMMNQMVQMTVVQAITNLNTLVSETNSLTYAASLVGKEVTIGQRNGDDYEEIRGTISGTGMLDGEQVVFMGNDVYKISDIIAVGTLPAKRAGAQGVTGTINMDEEAGDVRALAEYLGVQDSYAKTLAELWNKSVKGTGLSARDTETLYLYSNKISAFLNAQAASRNQAAPGTAPAVGRSEDDFSWLSTEYDVPEDKVEWIASILKYMDSGGVLTEELERELLAYGLIEPVSDSGGSVQAEEAEENPYKVPEADGTEPQPETEADVPNETLEEAAEQILENS